MSMSERHAERIAVLMGGPSSERAVSIDSGNGVLAALERLGYDAVRVDGEGELVENLRTLAPDIVFNALHGTFGEDGGVQAILEWMHLPYTGSGLLACAISMDKHVTKKLLAAEGLATPSWELFNLTDGELPLLPGSLGLPLVVKPRSEGSSNGVTIVRTHEEWAQAVQAASESGVAEILAESFVDGREFTVAVLGDEALPVIEIVADSAHPFYNYAAKYTQGGSAHIVPAPIDDTLTERLRMLALSTHRLLGLRDYSRTDLLVTRDGRPTILEINALPGLTQLSLLPDAAAAIGISYDEIIERLIGYARERARRKAALSVY